MILFNIKNSKIYNKIIYNFFKIEIFNNHTDIGDIIEIVMPRYLYRQNFLKCEDTFNELYIWLQDKFNHELDVYHNLALVNFLKYIKDKIDNNNKQKLYFDNELQKYLKTEIANLFTNESSYKNYLNYIYSLKWINKLFLNTEFLVFEKLFKAGKLKEYLEKNPKLIKKYRDILPKEIIEMYQIKQIKLSKEIENFITYLQDKIENGSLSKRIRRRIFS